MANGPAVNLILGIDKKYSSAAIKFVEDRQQQILQNQRGQGRVEFTPHLAEDRASRSFDACDPQEPARS